MYNQKADEYNRACELPATGNNEEGTHQGTNPFCLQRTAGSESQHPDKARGSCSASPLSFLPQLGHLGMSYTLQGAWVCSFRLPQ